MLLLTRAEGGSARGGSGPGVQPDSQKNRWPQPRRAHFPNTKPRLKIKTKKANEPISLFSFSLGASRLGAGGDLAAYQQPQPWGGWWLVCGSLASLLGPP